MGLESTLLALVASIVVWVVQRENCGVMNMVLRPVNISPNRTDFEIRGDLLQSVVDFVLPMILLKQVPLPVLEVLPTSLGGGSEAVADAQGHPNGEPTIFWCAIGVFVTVIFLIIAIQIINCCCCCCSRGDSDSTYSHLNRTQRAILEKSSGERTHRITRILYLALLAITLAFGVACVILIGVYFGSTGLVLNYLDNNTASSPNETTSLIGGINTLTSALTAFIDNGITGGQRLTNETLDVFINHTQAELTRQINSTIVNLQTYLQLGDILNFAQSVVDGVGTFEDTGKAVRSQMIQLSDKLASLTANIEKVKTDFNDVFTSMTPACDTIPACLALKGAIDNLNSPIDPNLLSGSAMDIFLSALTNFSTELKDLLQQLQTTLDSLDESKKEMSDELFNKLDINSQLGAVNDFWSMAAKQTGGIKAQLDNLVRTFEKELPTYIPYASIGLNVIGGVFILLTLIAVLVCIHLVYRGMMLRIYSAARIDVSENRLDKIVCGKGSVCCCSAFFIPILLIFAVIISVLLFLLTFISGEVCVYLVRESAINKTDFVVNGVLNEKWPSLVGDLSNPGGAGGAGDFLNLPPPRDLLFALTNTCNPSLASKMKGLLAAVGYTNLVDSEKLVNSPAIQNGIKSGEEDVVRTVKAQRIEKTLPTDTELQGLITLLNDAITALDLAPIIVVLDPTLLDTSIANIGTLADRVDAFVAAIKPNPAETALNEANKGLRKLPADLEGLKPDFDNLKVQLQEIESQKTDLITPVNSLVKFVKETRVRAADVPLTDQVRKEYRSVTGAILAFLVAEGDTDFGELTRQVFPCSEAYTAVSVGTGVTCGDTGILNRLMGAIYVLSLTILFITLFYFSLFNLAFVQAIRVRQLGGISKGDEG